MLYTLAQVASSLDGPFECGTKTGSVLFVHCSLRAVLRQLVQSKRAALASGSRLAPSAGLDPQHDSPAVGTLLTSTLVLASFNTVHSVTIFPMTCKLRVGS